MSTDRITVDQVRHWPKRKSLLALTAYDYSMARMLDEAGVDIIHVGDSMGMVVLGLPDTTGVTMADMLRATEAVGRGVKRALVTADLPWGSYKTPEDAVKNAQALINAGAAAVKLEGGEDIAPQVQALRAAAIEVQGHLGMLPQRVLEEGGYKRKGKTDAEVERLRNDSWALVKLGVFSIVYEVIVLQVAEMLTKELPVPTIGIGSGLHTTGQIQVTYDAFGMYPWFAPAHAKKVLAIHEQIPDGVKKLREAFLCKENSSK